MQCSGFLEDFALRKARSANSSLQNWRTVALLRWQRVWRLHYNKDHRSVLQALSDTENLLSLCVLQGWVSLHIIHSLYFMPLYAPVTRMNLTGNWAERSVFLCAVLTLLPVLIQFFARCDAVSNYKSNHTTCLLKLLSHSVNVFFRFFFYPCYLMFAYIFYLLHIIQVLR